MAVGKRKRRESEAGGANSRYEAQRRRNEGSMIPQPPPHCMMFTGEPTTPPSDWDSPKAAQRAAHRFRDMQCVRKVGKASIAAKLNARTKKEAERIREALLSRVQATERSATIRVPTSADYERWNKEGEPGSLGIIPTSRLHARIRKGTLAMDEGDVKFVSSLYSLAHPLSSPWRVPMSRAIILPAEEGNQWRPHGEVKLEVHVFIHRLACELISNHDLQIIFSRIESEAPVRERKPLREYDASLTGPDEPTDPFSLEAFMASATSRGYRRESQPPGLRVSLFPFQREALAWMLDMEDQNARPKGINEIFWEERSWQDGHGTFNYFPLAGEIRTSELPVCWGGMLSDEQGLGKTVEVLALVLSGKEGPTLVVSPPALLMQWKAEIEKTVEHDALNFYVCACEGREQGKKRMRQGALTSKALADELGRYDVVLTTYAEIGGARKGPDSDRVRKALANVSWYRVVLDECQEVRSSTRCARPFAPWQEEARLSFPQLLSAFARSQVAKEAAKLKSPCRWLVSGTPLFNSADDLRGELGFLNVWPFALLDSTDGFWARCVKEPIDQRSYYGKALLESLLRSVMFRRTKSQCYAVDGSPLITVPDATSEMIPVHLADPSERYVAYFLDCQAATNASDALSSMRQASSLHSYTALRRARQLLRMLRLTTDSPAILPVGHVESLLRQGLSSMGGGMTFSNLSEAAELQTQPVDEAIRLLLQPSQRQAAEGYVSYEASRQAWRGTERSYAQQPLEEKLFTSVARAGKLLAEKAHGPMNRTEANSISSMATELVEKRRKSQEDLQRKQRAAKDEREKRVADAQRNLVHPLDQPTSLQRRQLEALRNARARYLSQDTGVVSELAHNSELQLGEAYQDHEGNMEYEKLEEAILEAVQQNEDAVQDVAEKLKVILPTSTTARRLRNQQQSAINSCPQEMDKIYRLIDDDSLELRRGRNREEVAKLIWHYHDDRRNAWEEMQTTLQEAEQKAADERQERFEKVRSLMTQVERLASEEASSLVSTSAALRWSWAVDQICSGTAFQCPGENWSQWEAIPWRFKLRGLLGSKRASSAQARWMEAFTTIALGGKNVASMRQLRMPAKFVARHAAAAILGIHHAPGMWTVGNKWRNEGESERAQCEKANKLRSSGKAIEEEIGGLQAYMNILRRTLEMGMANEYANVEQSGFQVLHDLLDPNKPMPQCCICLGPTSQPAVTWCVHVACTECLLAWLRAAPALNSSATCPLCRQVISRSSLIKLQLPEQLSSAERGEEGENHGQRNNTSRQHNPWKGKKEAQNGEVGVGFRRAAKKEDFESIPLPTPGYPCRDGRFPTLSMDGGYFLAHLKVASGKRSSKMAAVIREVRRSVGKEKVVVFSQLKEAVEAVESNLRADGIECRKLVRGDSPVSASSAVHDFRSDPSVHALLLQAGPAASGLTLTVASRVILMEPFLSPGEEAQAIARCHRIGQESEVRVTRLFAKGTVEERLLAYRQGQNSSSLLHPSSCTLPITSAGEDEGNASSDAVSKLRFLFGLDEEEGASGRNARSAFYASV